MVGAEASKHQRLMSVSRAPEKLEPHLAMETSKSGSGSILGGSHLVRDQVEDLSEMPRDETLGEMPRGRLLVRCQEM
jgi:hypothetical protein